MRRAIVLLSGGIDSATALWYTKRKFDIYGLSFQYGERNRNEMRAARRVAEAADILDHEVIDLGFLHDVAELDEWSYGTEPERKLGMPPCFIPGRNTIFFGIAAYLAEIRGAIRIITGHIHEDNFPDAKPEYFRAINRTIIAGSLKGATGNKTGGIKVVTPFLGMSKAQVLRKALKLNVPLELTWSCHEDGSAPCGVCSGCLARKNALEEIKSESIKKEKTSDFIRNKNSLPVRA